MGSAATQHKKSKRGRSMFDYKGLKKLNAIVQDVLSESIDEPNGSSQEYDRAYHWLSIAAQRLGNITQEFEKIVNNAWKDFSENNDDDIRECVEIMGICAIAAGSDTYATEIPSLRADPDYIDIFEDYAEE